MSEIKFKYRKYYCDCNMFPKGKHCRDCHNEYASELGCIGYECNYDKTRPRPSLEIGSCRYAKTKMVYKCVNTKNFECEYIEGDAYYEFPPHICLTIGKNDYECTEVYIDGVRIFEGCFVEETE